jgi:hypothetical protein
VAAEFEDTNVQVIAMRNECPEDYHSEEIWKAQNELMRLALKTHGITGIDAVFSSEEYGNQLASYFGAEHVLVDLSRTTSAGMTGGRPAGRISAASESDRTSSKTLLPTGHHRHRRLGHHLVGAVLRGGAQLRLLPRHG